MTTAPGGGNAAPRLPERIETARLVLRRWTVDDVDRLARAVERNLEHLRPFMPWIAAEPLSKPDRHLLVEGWEQRWREGGDVVLAIERDGDIVGGCGLHARRGPGVLEIGYWVDTDALGLGIAAEAAEALTRAALTVPGVESVEIHHDRANTRSGAVPRRLGYEFVGETVGSAAAPGESGVDCAWRMTRAAWESL